MFTASSIISTDIRTKRTLRRFIATPQTPTKNRRVEETSIILGDTKLTIEKL
jgi:hypothetical protein